MYSSSQGYGIGSAPTPYFSQQESRLEYLAHSEISPGVSFSAASSVSSASVPYAPLPPGRVSSYAIGNNGSFNGNFFTYNLSSTPRMALYNSSGNGAGSYNPDSGPGPGQYSFQIIQPEYHFDPAVFLKPGREGGFVGKAEEVREFVEVAFEKIFHDLFPDDIKISVLPAEEFRKLAPSIGVIGLSLNRKQQGLLNEIFILNDSLARVMLTIGHELGHVLTPTLNSPHDEEAKAYAFSLEWMKVIKEDDIAGLGDAFVTERPAENGLHNVAFEFVERMLNAGKRAWTIYRELIQGLVTVRIRVGE
ncbi:MAG: hypothetical protein AABX13_06465 [Nanoarchaeota archaeon]